MKKKWVMLEGIVLGVCLFFLYRIGGTGIIEGQKIKQETEISRIALTFDDGPHPVYTEMLLDGLKEREVKVSFFVLGENIAGQESLLLRMQKEGHLIGNHTYHHVKLDSIPQEEVRKEIEMTSNRIFEITGKYPVYVRPPFGAWVKDMELAVTMLPVMWTIDTLDWKTQDARSSLEIAKRNAGDGEIILMHDGYAASVEAAFQIVDDLKGKGYQFVTVDQLLVT